MIFFILRCENLKFFFVTLQFVELITTFQMDSIANIAVSFPDTIAIATTPKEVIIHSCPDIMPIDNVFTICATVVICLLIITIATCICYIKAQEVKKLEIGKKFDAEENKRLSEQNFKKMQDRYDSAWRTFEYMLKEKLPKDCNDAGIKAREYIKLFWGKKTSDDAKDSQA